MRPGRAIADPTRMTKTAEDTWRGLIAAWARSGLGVRAFAEIRGLAPATMCWWRCRLRDRPAALVPVAVVGRDDSLVSGSTAREPFELAFGAMTLRIPAGFGIRPRRAARRHRIAGEFQPRAERFSFTGRKGGGACISLP